MGLSNYQGTPMSIHYAKRKYDETKLSKQEIDACIDKVAKMKNLRHL